MVSDRGTTADISNDQMIGAGVIIYLFDCLFEEIRFCRGDVMFVMLYL